MAHQGGKIEDEKERNKMYEWLDKLEFDLLELPKPDITLLFGVKKHSTLYTNETLICGNCLYFTLVIISLSLTSS